MTMDLARTKAAIGSGLLAFPVTHFDASGAFDEQAYRANIRANLEHGPAALFAPGGTGEFFSLTLDEFTRVVKAAVEESAGRVPIIAGSGYGTAMAIEFARAAERAGADGILLLPQYLLNVEQEGLRRHVEAVCRSVGIGIMVYNRDNSIFTPETLEKLAASCPNLIGFKDGHGDVEQLVRVRQRLGERFVYVGGMPTAEVFAVPYLAAGFTTYSSAIFNFIPKTAQRFYKAVRAGDTRTTDEMLRKFFDPYLALRSRKRGYAVSIVKAGMRIVGRPAGPVRAPLTDLSDAETAELRQIMTAAFGESFA
jgi:5-dehydro-4-deoxyglucarate dehydratase